MQAKTTVGPHKECGEINAKVIMKKKRKLKFQGSGSGLVGVIHLREIMENNRNCYLEFFLGLSSALVWVSNYAEIEEKN